MNVTVLPATGSNNFNVNSRRKANAANAHPIEAVNFAQISVIADNRRISNALPNALKIKILSDTSVLTSERLPLVTINFGLFSLFPPTFNNRTNGMRQDIAQICVKVTEYIIHFDLNTTKRRSLPRNLVFSGSLEETILSDQVGLNDGNGITPLDLSRHGQDAKDMKIDRCKVILDSTEYHLATFLTDKVMHKGTFNLDLSMILISFTVGDAVQSPVAAMRFSLSHPAPSNVKHVEKGDEASWLPPTLMIQYSAPNLKTGRMFVFILTLRDGTLYFEGEYAAISTNSDVWASTGRLKYPTVQGSNQTVLTNSANSKDGGTGRDGVGDTLALEQALSGDLMERVFEKEGPEDGKDYEGSGDH
ncbi:hypothetical protein K435DRAFT_794582 [Dendrothele bispora CBS 962.96]|uniref:Uncharacterized protein n=1 Tax=Dendrothele bispora (strain CBS 962.96) TaxID=1314807 RepID=A0A4S8MBK4_DENBC|nr:hypothetical protein K435DRAFT_794582 [Dendrothele bispora CBS 962.96]